MGLSELNFMSDTLPNATPDYQPQICHKNLQQAKRKIIHMIP